MRTNGLQLGIDTLLREHVGWLERVRVGLVAHRASVDTAGVASAERLFRDPRVDFRGLFGPEHGFGGTAGAGEAVGHARHPVYRVPIHSLYGETRRPTGRMLDDVDVVVFDLQDIAVRCYTYVSTLRLLLEAAAGHAKTVIVADRPVPLANTLDGPMLRPSLESFVGCIPSPLVYGMTPGETAQWIRQQKHLDVDLRIARLRNYHREARPGRAWPAWVPPSPAIRSWSCAACYPATVLTEALPTLDCRRSTRSAFQVLCASWLEGKELCRTLGREKLPGVSFEPVAYGDRGGARLRVVDPHAFLPVTTGVAMLCALRDLYGDAMLWQRADARPRFFDQLMGDRRVRTGLVQGGSWQDITADWARERESFEAERACALLYKQKTRSTHARPRARPQKAIVLAAGYGTRMHPLSADLPKPLMPLWGKPMLQHVLELLASWGVRDVLVNGHHHRSALLAFARSNPVPGVNISLSFEPTILGTGGALRRAQWFLDEQPFWLLNADIAAALDPEPLLACREEGDRLAALWLHAARGPRTVHMRDGLVHNFRSRRAGTRGTYTFCGLHLLSPRILQFLPQQERFASVIRAYERAQRAGEEVGGVCVPHAYWADIGSPRQYLETHREARDEFLEGRAGGRLFDARAEQRADTWRRKGVSINGFLSAAENVRLDRGATVTDAVLWPGAHVRATSRLRRAMVGRDVTVAQRGEGQLTRADRTLDPVEREALQALGWPLHDAVVETRGGRGSARTFARVSEGRRRVILMRYSAERRENFLYARHARVLRNAAVPVPEVLLDLPRRHLVLLEDLGDRSLEEVVPRARPARVADLYEEVLRYVARLHHDGGRAARRARVRLMPAFGRALYQWEADLFADQFLARHLSPSPGVLDKVRRELRIVGAHLIGAERVLVHRDLQSSNILLPRGRPVFIDFQGMRWGPAEYDLASLLCDPYVSLSESMQEALLKHYQALVGARQDVRSRFWWAAVQRLAQALGAYGRLSAIPGVEGFRRHMAPALRMLARALDQTGGLPELREIVRDANL